MNDKWTRGLKTEKDKEARRKEVLQHRNAFQDLTKVLEKHFLSEITLDYSKPGWEGETAQKYGERKAILEVLRLIDIKD